ncbi:MAG TPA: hypothetical protein VF974_02230 [Patescibacteria group bacterium]
MNEVIIYLDSNRRNELKNYVSPSDWAEKISFSGPSFVLGYLWLISGLNKIFNDQFVSNFGEYLRNQTSGGPAGFYKDILLDLVLTHSIFFANLIQYSEALLGLVLIGAAIWNLIARSRYVHIAFVWAYVASFFLILNFILSLSMPLEFIKTANAFAAGLSVDYTVLYISLFMILANYLKSRKLH